MRTKPSGRMRRSCCSIRWSPGRKPFCPPEAITLRELMIPVFLDGKCVYTSPSVMEIRDYCQKELDTLWDETRRLVNPHQVYVDLSQKLYDTKLKLLDQMGQV